MKLIHWAVIFVIVILPFSLICRNNINNRFMALKDEVRINNAIDTATQDAADLLAEWATVVGRKQWKKFNHNRRNCRSYHKSILYYNGSKYEFTIFRFRF